MEVITVPALPPSSIYPPMPAAPPDAPICVRVLQCVRSVAPGGVDLMKAEPRPRSELQHALVEIGHIRLVVVTRADGDAHQNAFLTGCYIAAPGDAIQIADPKPLMCEPCTTAVMLMAIENHLGVILEHIEARRAAAMAAEHEGQN